MSDSPAAILYDNNGNPVGVVLDGSIYRLQVDAKLTTGHGLATETTLASIKNTDGIKKITDPLPPGTNNIGDVDVVSSALPTGAATEATLATRATAAAQTDGSQKSQVVDSTGDGLEIDISGRAAIQNQPNMDVALSTRATEATLASCDGKLTTIDAVLDSIKDVDGIKKITDQLPAGTNEIGKVAQGTKGSGTNAWPAVLYDSAGNETGVLGNRLAVDTGAPIVGIISDKVKTAGGVTNMNVDGSVTPVVFTFDADPTNDILLQRMTIVFVSNVLRVDGVSFGPFGALTNGVRVTVTTDGTTIELGVLKLTEDLLSLSGATPLTETGLSANDLLVVSFPFGDIPLIGGSGDNVKFEVRDDLTDAGPNSIKSFSAKVVGLEA